MILIKKILPFIKRTIILNLENGFQKIQLYSLEVQEKKLMDLKLETTEKIFGQRLYCILQRKKNESLKC